jgi:hypothetical protein
LRSLKVRREFCSDIAVEPSAKRSWAMSLYLLDGIFRLFGIRGHIPGDDDFPERPARSSPGENSARVMRILVIVSTVVAVMLLVLWAAVSLAIKSQ